MDAASILMAATAVLGTAAVEESTKLALGEMWSALKARLKGQRGADAPALAVLDELERLPPETPPTPVLGARIAALRLADDPEIAALLQRVEALLARQAPAHIGKQFNFHGNTFHHTTFN